MREIAVAEHEIVVRFLVEPPAVDPVPRRVGVARGGGAVARRALLLEELGERGSGEQLVWDRLSVEKRFPVALDEAGIELGGAERSARNHRAQEPHVGRHAGDLDFGERLPHASEGTRAVGAAHHELRDHRVVPRRDFGALVHPGVDADMLAFFREVQVHYAASRGQEVTLGVLGIDACFDGMPAHGHVVLEKRQTLPRGDAQLPLHQIEAGDHLGDRMLDLQAGVHFHEIERAVLLGDEFHRARAGVLDRFRRRDRRGSHFPALAKFGAGASSITFWCRRCTEQSRSKRCTTLPCVSPKTCISMWRGRSR